MSNTVDAPGHPEVRITAGSGSITVIGEARDDVVADGGEDIRRASDGAFEIASHRRSRSMTVRCPEGASVMVGSRSGSLRLSGRLGAVRATTMSGSIDVEEAAAVDLRAMSGTITVGTCAGPCRIKTKSGSTHVGSAGSVEIHIGSGRVRIDHVAGAVTVRAVSGSVTLEAGGGGPIEVETMSGSITVVAAGRLQARGARQEPVEPAEDRVRARSRLQGRGADAVRWDHGPMPMTSSETVLDADVLTGAVAFTDICGFTEFTAVRGDRDALLLLGTQERLVRGCLPEGARVVKELGDGLLLWFPEAASALTTTLLLQDEFETESAATRAAAVGAHRRALGNADQTRRRPDRSRREHRVPRRRRRGSDRGRRDRPAARPDPAVGRSWTSFDIDELGPVVMKGLPDPVRLFRVARPEAGRGASGSACTWPATSPTLSAACSAARWARHDSDGRPSVSTAASSRPPSIDTFLKNWMRCVARARSSVSSQNRWPASVVGTSDAASASDASRGSLPRASSEPAPT